MLQVKRIRSFNFLSLLILLGLLSAKCTSGICQSSTEFTIEYTQDVSNKAISGRVILILNQDTLVDPDIPNPYNPTITFGMNFKNWIPGEKLILNSHNTDSYLSTIVDLRGSYSLRALIDIDTTSTSLFKDGVFFSEKIVFTLVPEGVNSVEIQVNNVLSGYGFKESENIRLLKLQSKLLSNFYKTPTFIEAAVILPESYNKSTDRQYPVVFVMPGWGATHITPTARNGAMQVKRYGMSGYGEEKIFVFLNQDSRYGYHVFADSENNGPRATSFVEEFIPKLEKEYRVVKNPNARYLIGQSSGAWAALWLMINYPDKFGMAWSGSPDPVDFRDFIGHDLYSKEANFFYDEKGELTSAMSKATGIGFTNKSWSEMETALGEGGQYQSFESVFGAKGRNNIPIQVFDRKTGKIFPKTIEQWRDYDINLFLLKNSKKLKNKLDGKINIAVADNDDFLLDGSVKLLKNTLDELKIESNIKLLEKGGHNTWTDEILKEMHDKMDKIYQGISK